MRLAAAALLLWLLGVAAPAQAHDARPLAVSIVEQSPTLYRVVVQPPPTITPDQAPRLLWPEACAPLEAPEAQSAAILVLLLSCPDGLSGSVAIDYPYANPSLSTLVRVERAGGAVASVVLPPQETSWTIPAEPDWRSVARDYLTLGFVHIWEGPDHLMFVAGLLLLARRMRRILLAVTGFTAAHSITLTLATLDVVRLPPAPVEAMIALSILFLAGELARSGPETFSRRYPAALSFGFGLLHGFGFAGALSEVGLPAGELALGLAGFNVGVELGQLAFIAVADVLVLVWRLAGRLGAIPSTRALEQRAVLAAAYLLGVPAALWVWERSAAALGV